MGTLCGKEFKTERKKHCGGSERELATLTGRNPHFRLREGRPSAATSRMCEKKDKRKKKNRNKHKPNHKEDAKQACQ